MISTDRKGQYHYSMTIGDEIATTLTPLTFRKAAFNGTQFDFQSENLGGTLLLSRVNAPLVQSLPLPAALTNTTDLTAGRVTASAGPVTFGATLANGHQSRASLERFDGNPLKGHLTTAQASSTVGDITIRLSDDSPDDREGGAILYSERVVVEDLKGNRYDSAEIGFRANRDGGLIVDGFPTASGAERILLNYDLRRFAEVLPTTVDSLKEVRFELQVGNDYLIEIASESRQTSRASLSSSPSPAPPTTSRTPRTAASSASTTACRRRTRSPASAWRFPRSPVSASTPNTSSTPATASFPTPCSGRTAPRPTARRPGWSTPPGTPGHGSSTAKPSAWTRTTAPRST